MNNNKNVTFIGLGTMGYHMAGHLSKSSLVNVKVYNRTIKKAQQWLSEFAGEMATTLEDCVSNADVIITCSGRDEDMMEIVFSDNGLYQGLKEESIFIDHTTTSFKLAKHISDKLKEKNIFFIDAPVSGGESGALNGVLSVMAGGDRHALERVKPIIDSYAKNIGYMGDSGYGQLAKMVNQICISGLLQKGYLRACFLQNLRVWIWRFLLVQLLLVRRSLGKWIIEQLRCIRENLILVLRFNGWLRIWVIALIEQKKTIPNSTSPKKFIIAMLI